MSTKTCTTCGQTLKDPRSLADHRRLMAIIDEAYHQWPEASPFKPDSAEHLRSWLICKAGPEWRTVATFDVSSFDDEQRALLIDAVLGKNTHGGITHDILYKVEPVSMSFKSMGQKEFGDLRTAIEEVIYHEIGVPAEQLLLERGRRA